MGPKDEIYREPFKGTYTLFPDNAADVDVSGADATFGQASTVFVGGAGAVVVQPWGGGADVTFTIPAGGVVPVRVRIVRNSGTTATLLKRVY